MANEFDETTAEDNSMVDTPKMTNWGNEPTIRDLKQTIDDAKNDQDSHIAKVDAWLKNRAAERTKVKGKSSVQPKLIRKQAEWRYASLSDPFLSTPDVFNVYPTTAGDLKRARQNELVLNKQFNTQIDKIRFIDNYVRDAVDVGTVIVRIGWESEEEEVTEMEPQFAYLPDNTGQLAQQYMALMQLRINDPEQYADHSTPALDHALERFQETGEAFFTRQTGEEPVTKIIETKNQPVVEVMPSRNVIIDPSCEGDLNKARFIGEKFKSSIAELTLDGKYTNLDKINVRNAESPLTAPDYEESEDQESFSFNDDARKQFIVHVYWGEWDVDGDGVATQQIVAAWVNDTCIRKELNPYPDKRPPFVAAQYMPVRNSVYGEPDGELLKDNQDIIGAVTRGSIDLMAKSANSQTGMRKDMLDVTNRRKFLKGLDYEFNGGVDPRLGVYQHTFPEIPSSAFNMLEVQNSEAESLTGIKDFHSGINSQSLGPVASNAGRALDASALREMGILRRLTQGMIEIGRKIIAMNAEFLSEEEVVRITDKEFVQVRRDDLSGKFDLRLAISTAAEDNQKAQELSFMLQTAGPKMDFGFQKIIHEEIAILRKMPHLADRIATYEPQPDPMMVAKAQKELELLDAQIGKENALSQKHLAEAQAAGGREFKDATQGTLNQAKAGEADAKGRLHSSQADKQDLDYIHSADGTEHARELEKQDRKDANDVIKEAAKGANGEQQGTQK